MMQPQIQTLTDAMTNHRRACADFSAIVAQGEGRWTNPSPCDEWDAGGVVEHVIGFHDELLLRPTGTEPMRADDDAMARWAVTVPAIDSAIDSAMRIASPAGPDGRDGAPMSDTIDLDALLPALTAEVLAHTWDLAKAIGIDPQLDTELSEVSWNFMRSNEAQVRSSGLFASAVPVTHRADAATQFIAFVGRDPAWAR